MLIGLTRSVSALPTWPGSNMATRKAPTPALNGPVQLANAEWDVIVPAGPRAQRDQATTTEWDHLLTSMARVRRPRISWWWGYRHQQSGWYATCYFCEVIIVRGQPAHGLNDDARKAIADHRAGHYPEMRDRLDLDDA